jgi:mannose-6-phosphate isomerase-like protein (cupin superfamily)
MNLIKKSSVEEICKGVIIEEILCYPMAPFKASFFNIKANSSSPMDSHEVKEIWLVISGSGILECGDQLTEIKEKDVIFFDSFEKHTVNNTSNIELKMISLWWS